MKITQVDIHNFRSILDASITMQDYTLLVGANNAGKSNVMNALRVFYEDLKWTAEDFPKVGAQDEESWITLTFALTDEEWDGLKDEYKVGAAKSLVVRKYLKSENKAKTNQSNLYAILDGVVQDTLFYGAKNVSQAKVGSIVYVPALTTPGEQMKTTGPSPLRNMLQFMFKKLIAKSPAYAQLGEAFKQLNQEARQENGFLAQISKPINTAISNWGIKIDLEVNTINPEEITKNLIRHGFIDGALGETSFELDKYGHGFQRSVIYELIRLAPTFKEEKAALKKEFNPEFTLVLFEEPEAFLHPSQQEQMAFHLRRLGEEVEQQVIITTHSAIFVGKACDNLSQLVRVQRIEAASIVHQPSKQKIEAIFHAGSGLQAILQSYVNDPAVPDNTKRTARALVAAHSPEELLLQEEQFRHQLWLDSERSSMFFANKVLLVEGATEKALFNYLLANQWSDLSLHKVFIIDVYGKFNFHRFMALMGAFGIAHGVLLDDDLNKNHHVVMNDFIDQSMNSSTLGKPYRFPDCLERFLTLNVVESSDKKPVEMLKAISTPGRIPAENLEKLRKAFCQALKIEEVGAIGVAVDATEVDAVYANGQTAEEPQLSVSA